jgi:glutathione S-transferase
VDGDLTLCESNAILQYLSEAHGDFNLWSRDPKRRADISRWLFWESSQWQPALIPVLERSVRQQLQSESTRSEPIDVNWNNDRFQSVAKVLDAHLSGRAFLVGDEITLADFSVGAMMMYVRSAHFPFAVFANVDAWYSRIESLPAWRATAEGPWRY